ncbi:hypothetical protein M438DRAFT_172858 [Aureobasidium pullulans EXF-150]|uniref:Ig-like domain-containing protein n=1 Tax=Aureobasidium pullulans EXF-150 TaxID=1043002 RepID=A0A074XWE0_AURPU|nr:uncharacterized protein M438DRAFT_172858 [Aureobasidium pullulans EXF-150]KEQ86207.1 hypothetical protein M438DRAFT_172858 [Aureobasidium pullulans EXF-150]
MAFPTLLLYLPASLLLTRKSASHPRPPLTTSPLLTEGPLLTANLPLIASYKLWQRTLPRWCLLLSSPCHLLRSQLLLAASKPQAPPPLPAGSPVPGAAQTNPTSASELHARSLTTKTLYISSPCMVAPETCCRIEPGPPSPCAKTSTSAWFKQDVKPPGWPRSSMLLAGRALTKQSNIFRGLRKGEQRDTAEQH